MPVGISFGSPTSGQGFDVSSTTSQIVGNLRNVETPWKDQLTTLHSQDTVISNLGTLMSNLSNDMSQLTDFSGIMAQKTGSSSNNSVLELSSADSTAQAGTHTVVVNSLATTSSGYMPELSNASSTLSGSITLQVGSGTAHTITLDSSDNTLSGLAKAINNSGAGITASVLTDASGSRLSLVSGTSGSGGNIVVTNNSIVAAAANTLKYSGTAGSGSSYSTGTMSAVASANESLSGQMQIQVGAGSAQTVKMSDVQASQGGTSLTNLRDYINANQATYGATAAIVANSDGTKSLSLTSLTSGSAGTLTVNSSLVDSQTSLGYTAAVTGSNASLTVDGVNLSSSSNIVSNLIPGVTFQVLSASANPVQVVIGNNNAGVESAVNSMVSDYNALMSAVHAQEGNDASGNPEPLYGSPTLSTLQSQLMQALNTQNPNGTLTSVSSASGTTLAGTMTIQDGSGPTRTIHVGTSGANTATDIYISGNTPSAVASGINSAVVPVSYTSTSSSSGTLSAPGTSHLAGSVSIQVGSGSATTVNVPTSGDTSLTGLAAAINNDNLGVTAAVTTDSSGNSTLTMTAIGGQALTVDSSTLSAKGLGYTASVSTKNGQSTINLQSQTTGSGSSLNVNTAGSSGDAALTVNPGLAYTNTAGPSGTAGSLSALGAAGDTLSGSMTIQVGSGATETVVIGNGTNSGNTIYTNGTSLASLQSALSSISGVSATMSSDGKTLSLSSSSGSLTVNPSITDNASLSMSYTNSSDVSTLAGLGISVSALDNGSLSFNVATLDSALNSDFNSVVGFFQGLDSWGQNFSTALNSAGSSSHTGTLYLAAQANNKNESTLNKDISKEELLISAEQKSISAELISANEILQSIPSQLSSVNMLYSAITGYNQSSN